MEQERDEVYERIPWETLESKGGDRQWLVYAVAGALVIGALAYSFTRNRPPAPAQPVPAASEVSTAPGTTTPDPVVTSSAITAAPVVVAEADLFAVDPERLVDQAAAHAEWFAVEYVSYDGTEAAADVLRDLLPTGVPLPDAPDGTQVFVDWAGATSVTQTGRLAFDVDVIVRSLLGRDGSAFVRQAPIRLTVPVAMGDDGAARVTSPPFVAAADLTPAGELELVDIPDDVAARIEIEGEIVGGRMGADGEWVVVVMINGPDGVRRPETVTP